MVVVVLVQVGNTGPVQEFNIQVDPEAAKIVFNSGRVMMVHSLSITWRCVAHSPTCLPTSLLANTPKCPGLAMTHTLPPPTAFHPMPSFCVAMQVYR